MSELVPEKIHIKCLDSIESRESFLPRKYTLTHSDFTGDLFLTISKEFDTEEFSDFYTKLMRDEVLAEWKKNEDEYELHVYLHVSGDFAFGGAWLRDKIFRHHMPHVLKVIRYGDNELFETFPELDDSNIIVHFQSQKKKYDTVENYGKFREYKEEINLI